MAFQLEPMLETMIAFYEMPRGQMRFETYIDNINQRKNDPLIAWSAYNPMGKEHVLERLWQLKNANAEEIAANEIQKIKDSFPLEKNVVVTIALADDWKGGWTNSFTTHYQSLFQIKNCLQRQQCIPYFWTSEPMPNEQEIAQRIRTYLLNFVFQSAGKSPQNLAENLLLWTKIEANLLKKNIFIEKTELELIKELYEKNAKTAALSFIIPFLYGDEAVQNSGHAPLGMSKMQGFDMAKYLVS
jgi:hypothetical protein